MGLDVLFADKPGAENGVMVPFRKKNNFGEGFAYEQLSGGSEREGARPLPCLTFVCFRLPGGGSSKWFNIFIFLTP